MRPLLHQIVLSTTPLAWHRVEPHQVSGAAERSIAQHGHEGAVESVHGGQARQRGVGHALRHHQGSHGHSCQHILLQAPAHGVT